MRVKLSKQSIFDAQGNRAGAEVFLHSTDRPGNGVSSNRLIFIMIKSIAEYGVTRIDDGRKIFIRIPLDSLLMKVFDLINPFSVVYKLYPPYVSNSTAVLTSAVKANRKKILITNVNNKEDLQIALKMGDLVSGHVIEEPRPLKEIKLSPFLRSTLLRLLTLLNTSEDIKEYAKVIETDAGMSAKLLRFVNSAYFSIQSQIKSIEQAAAFFGLKQLRNFILVISINDYASVGDAKLWKRSLIRAKIMEGLAKKRYLQPRHTQG